MKGAKTRKVLKLKKKMPILTIPELRKSFDHMDKVVESLRKMSKHSFSDAVIVYREEWRKTFKRDISPADASAYLKFRFNTKAAKTRRTKMRGGNPLSGAPLEYTLRPGVQGVYGNFPSYQTEGLDRYYDSAIKADCGQKGGSSMAGLRGFDITTPPSMPYKTEMNFMGAPAFPTSSIDGMPAVRTMPAIYIPTDRINADIRSYPS